LVNVPTLACDNITTPCNVPDFAHAGFGSTALNASQQANVMSATAQFQTPVGEEIIKRTRKGFQVATDWVVNDNLRAGGCDESSVGGTAGGRQFRRPACDSLDAPADRFDEPAGFGNKG